MSVKKYFEGQQHFGNTDIPTRSARPDASGIVTVEGLDPGSYVFEVEARGHAKAYSDPFVVALGAEAPIVDMHLNEGGVIEGLVTSAGKPLAEVQVQTLPNHHMDNPFFAMLGGLVPNKITTTSTKTDAEGRYRLNMLAPGEYQVKFVHPEYYEVTLRSQMVATGETTRLQDVVLNAGTVISGLARVGGKPAAQVKVTVNTAPDPTQTDINSMFHCETITGNDGQFTLPKRIPPGRYQVMAARQNLGNPLLQIADYAKTKQEIVLAQGQTKFTLNIQIPDDPVR
jgi:5-hydroxyisourate hydrolase-like protein (transthyretin family)